MTSTKTVRLKDNGKLGIMALFLLRPHLGWNWIETVTISFVPGPVPISDSEHSRGPSSLCPQSCRSHLVTTWRTTSEPPGTSEHYCSLETFRGVAAHQEFGYYEWWKRKVNTNWSFLPRTLCHPPGQHRGLCDSIVKVPVCPPPTPRPLSEAGNKNELCLNSRAHKATPKTGLSHCWSIHWEQGHVRPPRRWGAIIPTYKLSCLWWIQIESSGARHPEGT